MGKKRKTLKKIRSVPATSDLPSGYQTVLSDVAKLIANSRQKALATANRELVLLYWRIGAVIVHQQETASWGDGVVEQLAADLRTEFPDMRGFSRANVFQMRQLVREYREIDVWITRENATQPITEQHVVLPHKKVATVSGLFDVPPAVSESDKIVQTASGQFSLGGFAPEFGQCILNLSWSHHITLLSRCDTSAERYFYLKMSIRERWSVRELRRQIDSALFTRYMSVRDEPEKCLPDSAESGDLLPFKDHYVLEFLGLDEEHSERELRHAILANLRDFFLEFGRDLAFVGEEYPLTVGSETFRIDLVFFHRRLQCLIAVELKIGVFKPEYVGKSLFYTAALDDQIRLPDEKPSLGLILCKDADHVQVRLTLSAAAEQIGVATYQTALPDESLLRQRLEQFPTPREDKP